MSEDMFEDSQLDDILNDMQEEEKAISPRAAAAKKAAATRKANAAAKAAQMVEDSFDDVMQPSIKLGPGEKQDSGKKYKYKKGEMRWITVQKERGKGGDRGVPVCVQGRQFIVPRGVKVHVPAMVAEVLMNAEETIVEWDGVDTIDSRSALSYPTAVHDG